jgi:photosystem II stability/assembly factor-like uncharacterized protein
MPSPHADTRQNHRILCVALALIVSPVGTVSTVALARAQAEGGWRQTGGPEGGAISDITVDSTQSDTLYAGTDGAGLFRSANGGTSWATASNGLPITSTIVTVAVSPGLTDTVYAGTDGGGVYFSSDGGATWQAPNTGLPDKSISGLLIDPTDPAQLIVGTDSGVARSSDGGASWVSRGLTETQVTLLVSDTISTNVIYAGTYNSGLFVSDDRGASWLSTGMTSTSPSALAISSATPNTIYAGTFD